MPSFEFGEWVPDQGEIGINALTRCENAYPTARGYRQWPGVSSVPGKSALPSEVVGAWSSQTDQGDRFIVVGTDTPTLHSAFSTADFADHTPAAGLLTGFDTVNGTWHFDQYGNNIFATSYGIPAPLYLDCSTIPGGADDFAQMSADTSKAAVFAIFRDFLILGKIVGRGANASAIGDLENGLHWSAIGNPLSFPTVGTQSAIDVQSDFQIMSGDGGEVTAIIPVGEYCAIFQQNALWRMDYVGTPAVFSLRLISPKQGCVAPNMAVVANQRVYFVSADGFKMFDGANVVDIGKERVDRTFMGLFNSSRVSHAASAYDAQKHSVLWTLPESDNLPTSLFGYNYQLDRWYEVRDYGGFSRIFSAAELPLGGSLDDAPLSTMKFDDTSGPDPVDLEEGNLDSFGIAGSELSLVYINGDNEVAIYGDEASPSDAFLETGYYELPEMQRGFIRWCRPYWDGTEGNILVSAAGKNYMRDPEFFKGLDYDYERHHSRARVGSRAGGRYLRAQFLVRDNCEDFYGFDAGFETNRARR